MAPDRGALPEYHSIIPVNSNGSCVIIAPVQINIQNIYFPPTSVAEQDAGPALFKGFCTNPIAFIGSFRERKVSCSLFNAIIAIFALIATIVLGILQLTGNNPTGPQAISSGNGKFNVGNRSSIALRSYHSFTIFRSDGLNNHGYARDAPTLSITQTLNPRMHEGIEKQGDKSIMYGGIEPYGPGSVTKPVTKTQTLPHERTTLGRIEYGICHIPRLTSQPTLGSGASRTIARETQPTKVKLSIPNIEMNGGVSEHDEL